jgi:hypothetical protein
MSFRATEVRCEEHNISGGGGHVKAPSGWVIVDVLPSGTHPNVVILVMAPTDIGQPDHAWSQIKTGG